MNAPQQKENSGNNAEAHIHGAGLFIAIGALGLSLLSTGLWIATMIFGPQLIQARIDAGAADANSKSELAMKTAYTAKDQVDVFVSRAKAKEGDKK